MTCGSSSISGCTRSRATALMQKGITLPRVAVGELIFLNLPDHPGAGTDHTPPTAPSTVTATLGTNIDYPGVEIKWSQGSDNNWLSYYRVTRNGKVIGEVAKGTFWFDHTPQASLDATYGVQSVDGDGNMSGMRTATVSPTMESNSVDDVPGRRRPVLGQLDSSGEPG